MDNNKRQSLLIYYLALVLSVIFIFVFGSLTNIGTYHELRNPINTTYETSGLTYMNIYAKYGSEEDYHFDEIQNKISSKIKSNGFSALPMYNINDELNIRVVEYPSNSPFYIVPNSNWTISGNKLDAYQFPLVNPSNALVVGTVDNSCISTEALATKLHKNIGDLISVSINNQSYSYFIMNLIRNDESIKNGIGTVYGDSFIVANQDPLPCKKDLCVCNYQFKNGETLFTILEFKSLVNNNSAIYYFQKMYLEANSFSDIYERKVCLGLGMDVTKNLPLSISFLVISLLLLACQMIYLRKGFIYFNKKHLLISSGVYVGISFIFGLVGILQLSMTMFSLPALIVLGISIIINSSLYFIKGK